MNIFGIILAGGGGERFWPLSRRETPKQLLNLTGKDIMVNETIDRLSSVCRLDHIFLVTNISQTEKVKEATASRLNAQQILSEPACRNTAACIGYAAMRMEQLFGDGVLIVTPSDAYIKDLDAFTNTLKKAVNAAQNSDSLITIGIKPSFPATGYGYIRFEKSGNEAKKVLQFVEKPDKSTAECYLKSGDFLWNSGMFLFKASAILKAYQRYTPDIYAGLKKICDAIGTAGEQDALKTYYPKLRSISIDYAIMEKSDDIIVFPGDFGWSDVGSFDMLSAIYGKDENQNIILSDHIGFDTKDCVIYSQKKLVATIGIHDLILVETDDALLVCDKSRAQDIKKIVEELRRRGREELL